MFKLLLFIFLHNSETMKCFKRQKAEEKNYVKPFRTKFLAQCLTTTCLQYNFINVKLNDVCYILLKHLLYLCNSSKNLPFF